MKKLLLLFVLFALPVFGQGVRFGDSDQIIAGQIPGGPLYSVPNAVINFCNSPNVNVPCANKITTYTDATLTTPCSTSTQVVLAGTNSCVGTTDGYGNWGVWVPSGTYTWTVTVPGGATLGPFTATLAAGGSSSSLSINGFPVTNPNLNAVLPTADASFLACSAKVGGSNFIVECPFGTTGSTFLLGNGNAATSSALAATPTNCGSTVASTGISANGNAIGCFTPAGTPSGASTAVQINNSGVFGGVNPPSTPNLPYTLTETPSGGVAQTPVWELPGLGSRNVTGTTSTDTVLASDCDPITRVGYTGSVNVAVTLPTATTLAVPNCSFRIANDTNPAHTVTVTPTTWTISSNGSTGLTSLAVTQGQVATFVVDAAGSIWDVDVSNSSGATIQTIGTNNSSQSNLDFIASTVNAAGLTVTPSNPSAGQEKFEVTGSVSNQPGLAVATGTLTTTSALTQYVAFAGNSASASTQNNLTAIASPTASTVSELNVAVSVAPGTSNTFTVALYNGSAQAVTCTISGAAQSCQDLTHSFSPAPGDNLSWRIIASSGVGSSYSGSFVISSLWGGNVATGLISSGASQSLAYYAANGTTLSPLNALSGLSLSGGVLTNPSVITSGSAGTLAYYGSSGTTVVPLTLGAGLSITGSTLNALGGLFLGATSTKAVPSGNQYMQVGTTSSALVTSVNSANAAYPLGRTITVTSLYANVSATETGGATLAITVNDCSISSGTLTCSPMSGANCTISTFSCSVTGLSAVTANPQDFLQIETSQTGTGTSQVVYAVVNYQ